MTTMVTRGYPRAAMEKQLILDRIVEIARANAGSPPGRRKFQTLTGITSAEWGEHWLNWGDALIEAGFEPNKKQGATDKEVLLAAYLALVIEIGHIPTEREIRFHARNNPHFPGRNTFRNVFGRKNSLLHGLDNAGMWEGVETPGDESSSKSHNFSPFSVLTMSPKGDYYTLI